MKRKLAVLTALGALVALAIPASSTASMYPAGHQFQIGGGPKLATSLGSCNIAKITGTIPAAPANESASSVAVTPTVGSCTTGASLTLAGSWVFGGQNASVALGGPAASATMRFSSLPGCKLSTNTAMLMGIWSNGTATPKLLQSSYHPHSAQPLTWSDDGGTCALAGKTETLSWTSPEFTLPTPTFTTYTGSTSVTDLTNPSAVVIIGLNK